MIKMKIKLSYVNDPDFDKLKERYSDDELALLDSMTPVYSAVINSVSIQKRKILAVLARHGKPIRINELTALARLGQQNKTSSQVSRLVEEGFLTKQERGYYFNPEYPGLEKFLIVRTTTQFRDVFTSKYSKGLIPDRKKPVTYFVENKDDILSKYGRLKQK